MMVQGEAGNMGGMEAQQVAEGRCKEFRQKLVNTYNWRSLAGWLSFISLFIYLTL
jgi:hypothetical protein